MLQRFVQVLQGDDRDDAHSEVLRRFWTRAKPLPVRFEQVRGSSAGVVDLAQWSRSRRVDR
jgi:hypothetical protein